MTKPILLDKETLLIDLRGEYLTISTAGCPKVYSNIKYIVFKSIPKNFGFVDLDNYCKELTNSIGLDYEKTTVFLTAVDVSTYSHSVYTYNNVKAEAYVTFGINRPSCISNIEKNATIDIDTINVAIIVDKPLDPVGLLDLFRLVSEVKGATIALGGPTCMFGASIGTASDALAVAAPKGVEKFAGIATPVGIASALAVLNALSKHLKIVSSGSYIVKSLGFKDLDEIIRIIMKVYAKARIPQISDEKIKAEVENELNMIIDDPNVGMFIRGLRLLEVALALGVVPVINIDEYISDSPGIVVDELAGKSLAEYINGFKGLLAYYWVERLKERGEVEEIRSLPPITDDLVAALVGGILSRVYDKYSRS
ncbi:MAG: adenosylcobinamide amidohydrolase [Ignisphaera sp.]